MPEKLSEKAYRLHYVEGMTWREVGDAMGRTRAVAKSMGQYWRKREQIAARSRDRYANDPAYRSKKLDGCKRYRNENREEILKRQKEQRDSDPERFKGYQRRSRERYGERWKARRRGRYATDEEYRNKSIERQRDYRSRNIEKCRAASREYQQSERGRVQRKAWVSANRESILEKQRAYRKKHAERTKAVQLAWQKRNAEHVKAYRVRYRAANRQELLTRMSVWRYGPEWGLVHRAICDIKATIKELPHEQSKRPHSKADPRHPGEEPRGTSRGQRDHRSSERHRAAGQHDLSGRTNPIEGANAGGPAGESGFGGVRQVEVAAAGVHDV